VTCDGRLFHRREAATGNALSQTVDRRVDTKGKGKGDCFSHEVYTCRVNNIQLIASSLFVE